MIMDDLTQYILKELAVDPDNMHGTIIPREMLLSDSVYEKIRPKIPELKKRFSTSYLTCLHENAGKTQKMAHAKFGETTTRHISLSDEAYT